MFNKILVANRGEIAVRIIRACRELGIETVAVYSEADKNALHTMLADKAVCIGKASAKDSYLNMENIISATVVTGAQAIHPGFGFLAENSKFAKMCEKCNITFIGPTADMIDAMGNKAKARDMMKKAGVPIIPGSDGAVNGEEDALKVAESIGFPLLIKASAGGGGKGIRVVREKENFLKEFRNAKAEAKAAFNDDDMYIEKLVENAKHIEFQILGDDYGNIISLGERDCSAQRKNQKVLEEAPSPIMSEELRKTMSEAAINAAKAVNYKNAGTIEFLLDKSGKFYFMEMNTRLQVEHPITEVVTGVDIVKEQIKIASGMELSYDKDNINIKGHAIECRINAEDPSRGFMPSPGKIEQLFVPGGPGIRIDSSVYQGYVIPPNYDSMIAKLIVWGKDREEAVDRMRRALCEFNIKGIKNNIDFQLEILDKESFEKGTYNTSFIANEF